MYRSCLKFIHKIAKTHYLNLILESKTNFNQVLIVFILINLIPSQQAFPQQSTFTCQNEAYQFLKKTIGIWEVSTKDRTSPGQYENNTGQSVITDAIEGCGIKESYRGTFRGKDYAREVGIMGKDSQHVEMIALDSEHGSYSALEGTVYDNQMEVYWYRDKEVKRLQSKYILTILSENQFEFSSFLSMDHGVTWALTHERKYTRTGQESEAVHGDTTSIQNILSAYYDCISGPIGQVRDFDRLKSLFHPNARLIYSHWNTDVSQADLMTFTIDEFIGKLGYLDKKGFYEKEISNKIHSFGSVNQVFSTYRFWTEDQSISGQGITSYELYFDGSRYWIMSMFWMAENDKYKIPHKYLD